MTGNVLQLRVSGRARQDVTVDNRTDFPVVLTPALSVPEEAANGLTITPWLE